MLWFVANEHKSNFPSSGDLCLALSHPKCEWYPAIIDNVEGNIFVTFDGYQNQAYYYRVWVKQLSVCSAKGLFWWLACISSFATSTHIFVVMFCICVRDTAQQPLAFRLTVDRVCNVQPGNLAGPHTLCTAEAFAVAVLFSFNHWKLSFTPKRTAALSERNQVHAVFDLEGHSHVVPLDVWTGWASGRGFELYISLNDWKSLSACCSKTQGLVKYQWFPSCRTQKCVNSCFFFF